MKIIIKNPHNSFYYRILSSYIIFTFIFSLILPPGFAQISSQTVLNLPILGTMVTPTNIYYPALIKGITIHPENALKFDFIVDTGDSKLDIGDQNTVGVQDLEPLRKESIKLIKYFLAALTTPEENMWVNLNPYEQDRIVPEGFGQTEMGRDLLAQDYMLKQLTASLMYPEDELGSEFWERVYDKALEKYGTTEIPMNTFNKVWIVPEKATVYEHENSAFVVESKLKVMLEEDYVALSHQMDSAQSSLSFEAEHESNLAKEEAPAWDVALKKNVNSDKKGMEQFLDSDIEIISGITSEFVKEIIIPEIEREVNQGTTFAQLRQVYHSLILAKWYKENLKESLLGYVYVDKNKIVGVDVEDKKIKEKIYNQYVESFKKGVYNYIREDYDPGTQSIIPRKYFSGGFSMYIDNLNIIGIADRTGSPIVQKMVESASSSIGQNVRVRGDLKVASSPVVLKPGEKITISYKGKIIPIVVAGESLEIGMSQDLSTGEPGSDMPNDTMVLNNAFFYVVLKKDTPVSHPSEKIRKFSLSPNIQFTVTRIENYISLEILDTSSETIEINDSEDESAEEQTQAKLNIPHDDLRTALMRGDTVPLPMKDGLVDHTALLVPQGDQMDALLKIDRLKADILSYIKTYVPVELRRYAEHNLDNEALLPYMIAARRYNILLVFSREIDLSKLADQKKFGPYLKHLLEAFKYTPIESFWELDLPLGWEIRKLEEGKMGFLSLQDEGAGGGAGVTIMEKIPIPQKISRSMHSTKSGLSVSEYNPEELAETIAHELEGHKRSLSTRPVYEIDTDAGTIKRVAGAELIMPRSAWVGVARANGVRRITPLSKADREKIAKDESITFNSLEVEDLPEDADALFDILYNLSRMPFGYYEDILELVAFSSTADNLLYPLNKSRNRMHNLLATREILKTSLGRIGIPVDPVNHVYVSNLYDKTSRKHIRHFLKNDGTNAAPMWVEVTQTKTGWKMLRQEVEALPEGSSIELSSRTGKIKKRFRITGPITIKAGDEHLLLQPHDGTLSLKINSSQTTFDFPKSSNSIQTLRFGRSRDNDVRSNIKSVSTRHFVIMLEDDQQTATIIDLHSSNGTFLITEPANNEGKKVLEKVSSALTTRKGGIDLNPEFLDIQIKRDGNGAPLPVWQQPILEMNIQGFLPVIINITPVTNLPALLGLTDQDNPFTYPSDDEAMIHIYAFPIKKQEKV